MKIQHRIALLIVGGFLHIASYAQNPVSCPAMPQTNYFDPRCYMYLDEIQFGQGRVKNPELWGNSPRELYVPVNRPEWAIASMHGWQLMRNILKKDYYDKHVFFATALKESFWNCDANISFAGLNLPYDITTNSQGNWSGVYQNDGCFHIAPSGYTWLKEYYPWRHSDAVHEPYIAGNSFITGAISKVHYDLLLVRFKEFSSGLDPMGVLCDAADPFAADIWNAKAYNRGYGAAGIDDVMLNGNRAASIANGDWMTLSSLGYGYTEAISHVVKVLSGNYPPGDTMNEWHSWYDTQITWPTMDAYMDSVIFMYPELTPGDIATVKTTVQNAFNTADTDVDGGVSFRYEFGPVLDAFILAMPYDDPMPAILNSVNSGAGCSGCIGPYVTIQANTPTTICRGMSVELETTSGTGYTYQWTRNDTNITNSNPAPYILYATETGTYNVIVTNSNGCSTKACCPVDVIVLDTCSSCNMTVNTAITDNTCTGVGDGQIIATPSGVTGPFTFSWTGPVTGSSQTLTNAIEGNYTLEVTQISDTTCKGFASATINEQNVIYQALTLDSMKTACGDWDLTANVVDNPPSNCGYTVSVDFNSGGGCWGTWPTADWNLKFLMDGVEVPISNPRANGGGNCNHLTEVLVFNDGANISFQVYKKQAWASNPNFTVTVTDPNGATVFTHNMATQSTPNEINSFEMATFTASCSYTAPAYTISWSPLATLSNITNGSNTSSADASISATTTYTVTASTPSIPQCTLSQDITVIPTCGGATCEDPGLSALSPANPPTQCGGGILLTSSQTGSHSGGGFNYEFFFDGGSGYSSVQSGTITTLNASNTGNYYVVISDAADPTVCRDTSNIVSVTIEQAPTIANAGNNRTICSLVDTLRGNFAFVGTASWSVQSGTGGLTILDDSTVIVSGMSSGSNDFRYSITNGSCTASESNITITVEDAPTITDAGINDSICTDNTNLSASIPTIGSGTWTTSGGATIATPTSATSSISTLDLGENWFYWTVINGGCVPVVDSVVVYQHTPPSTSNAGANDTICTTSTTLAANASSGSETGQWVLVSGSATIDSPNAANSNLSFIGPGPNVLRWTLSTGSSCTSSSSDVTIFRYDYPSSAQAGPDQTLCDPNTTLSATAATVGNGYWQYVSGNPVVITDSINPVSTVTSIAVGSTTLQWVVNSGTCTDSTDQLVITRTGSAAAAVSLTPATPAPVCQSLTQTFTASPVNEGSTPSFYWFINNVLQTENSDTLARSNFSNGDSIHVILKSSSSCASPDSVVSSAVYITTDDPPSVADGGADQIICADSATLDARGLINGTGQWAVLTGPATIQQPTDSQAVVSGIAQGNTVELVWTTSNGVCPDDTSIVRITRLGTLTSPNAGNDSSQCETSSNLVLYANTPGIGESGSWSSLVAGPTFTSNTDPTTTVSNLSTGINTLIWTISNGTCPSSSDTLIITLDQQPTTASAGPNETVCADLANLSANSPVVGQGQWTVVSGSGTFNFDTSSTAVVTGLSTGTNTLMWSITSGNCPESTSTVDITRSGGLTSPNAGSDVTACSINLPLALNANDTTNGGTGIWSSKPVGAIFSNINQHDATVSNLTNDTTVLYWTISSAACGSISDSLTIVIHQQPTTSTAGVDQTTCVDSAILNANVPTSGIGVWSIVSGIGNLTDALDPGTSLTGLTGSVIAIWTISNGNCPASIDTVNITSTGSAPANVTLSTSNDTVCFGSSATFTATGNGGLGSTYEWFIGGISQGAASTSNTFNTIPINGLPVSVLFTSDLSCASPDTASSSMNMVVENAPIATISTNNAVICEDESTVLNVAGSGSTFTWFHGSNAIGTGSSVVVDDLAEAGAYYVVASNNVCTPSLSNTISISVDQLPGTDAGPDQHIDIGTSATLYGSFTSNSTSISWTPAGDLDNPNILKPIATPNAVAGASIVYTLTIENGECTQSDSMELFIIQPVIIPNAFTPNADNQNDNWGITGLDSYPEYILTVYNRWGMPVFKSLHDNIQWDGRRNGELMPVATYYYTLDLGNGSEIMTGSVTLLR